MGKYFTISELTKSITATAKKIDNTPTEEIKQHLEELIEVIDPIREEWTKLCTEKGWDNPKIRTNIGYRCPILNKVIGGSKTSAHMTGYAIDFEPDNQKMNEFWDFIRDYLTKNNIPFDQCIREFDSGMEWFHFGLKNLKGLQRKQIFIIRK